MLLLSVSDTGRGIEEAIRERVFLPFFTTKADHGRATRAGDGLFDRAGIGRTDLGRWRPDPRDHDPRAVAAGRDAAVRSLRRGRGGSGSRGAETILVVEDEPAVLTLLERVLSGAGYVVVTASSGVEALAVTATRSGDIHLLVSDAVMPGMTGLELAR